MDNNDQTQKHIDDYEKLKKAIEEKEVRIREAETQLLEIQNRATLMENQLNEMENNWKRALADYKNYQSRMLEEKAEIIAYAGEHIFANLLGVLDNLEMTAKHCDDMGLKLTITDFKQVLEKNGVREFEVIGKDFDAKTMEAIDTVEGEFNKVIEVLNKGYLFKEKVLRPARVKVGKGGN